jgi:predicted MPP superfamily phosphohydrolase
MPARPLISRRSFLRAATYAAAGCGATTAYTFLVEPHWVEFTERSLPLRNLPRDLQGKTLVQISDIHVGVHVDDTYLRSAFGRVRHLSPDFVVYTGDFVSYESGQLDHFADLTAAFPHGSLGTFGVLGNHDYGNNWRQAEVSNELARIATTTGVRILRNETVETSGLHISGLDDWWANRFDPAATFAELPAGTAGVALSHNPDTADLRGWERFSGWILAGHTHGGQCKPPFLSPPLLPVHNRRYTSGIFELSPGRSMYINRGLGHLLKVRFNARPEITVFRLERV